MSHPIVAVATSITAFIGRTLRGPTETPGTVKSFADFQRLYGGLWVQSTLGYAVSQFFQNGGSQALIVRVHNGATTAKASRPAGGINLIAANAGAWGNSLRARIDAQADPASADFAHSLFDLHVKDLISGTVETFVNLSTDPDNAAFITAVLAARSRLVRVDGPAPAGIPPANAAPAAGADPFTDPTATSFADGDDGGDITDAQISGPSLQPQSGGLWTLDQADLFNLLCIPPLKRSGGDVGKQSWDAAIAYAKSRRAFVIVDPAEGWTTVNAVLDPGTGITNVVTAADNAAIYFPRILAGDPLKAEQIESFAPSGAVAGIIANTDTLRGVWKAPAGIEAVLRGALGLSLGGGNGTLTNADNARLSSAGINCLRSFPTTGNVVWGARTLNGADALASEWKYIPVRRLGSHIEESVFRGTQWAVFEPNAAPLWAQVRSDVTAFMQALFAQGAFPATTPPEAYFVRCDNTTTTLSDIDNGIMNIWIGFASIRAAEFTNVQIRQVRP